MLCSFVRSVPLPHHPHAGARHQRGGGRHHVRRHPHRGDHHATHCWSRRRSHRQLQGTVHTTLGFGKNGAGARI